MNWRILTSGLLLTVLAGCSTGPVVHLIPNDRELQTVYDQGGNVVHGRASISDGYLRQIEQRLHQCEADARPAGPQYELTPASFPPDTFKCTVRGTIYAMAGKLEGPNRTDGCLMIRHDIDGNGLTLRYSSTWVLIPFPPDGGHQAFAYRWGSLVATIAGREVPIAWGRE